MCHNEVTKHKEDEKMKICLTEAMKFIKELEQEKQQLTEYEDRYCKVSYREGEPVSVSDYDYAETREKIDGLDMRVLAVRSALAKANCTVMADEKLTIAEALVYLAQLQKKREQLEFLSRQRQLSRRITENGTLEYTKCTYDVAKAAADLADVRRGINRIQMAIDRANLTNYIEV